MKKFISFTIVSIVMTVASLVPTIAIAQNNNLIRGVVVCEAERDYSVVYIREANRYVIVRWRSGPRFFQGDTLVGNLISEFSAREVYVNSNGSRTRTFIEYHYDSYSRCLRWLESQNIEPVVYICTGQHAKKYHCDGKCAGLQNCSRDIRRIPVSQAKDMGRTECFLCYEYN